MMGSVYRMRASTSSAAGGWPLWKSRSEKPRDPVGARQWQWPGGLLSGRRYLAVTVRGNEIEGWVRNDSQVSPNTSQALLCPQIFMFTQFLLPPSLLFL